MEEGNGCANRSAPLPPRPLSTPYTWASSNMLPACSLTQPRWELPDQAPLYSCKLPRLPHPASLLSASLETTSRWRILYCPIPVGQSTSDLQASITWAKTSIFRNAICLLANVLLTDFACSLDRSVHIQRSKLPATPPPLICQAFLPSSSKRNFKGITTITVQLLFLVKTLLHPKPWVGLT